MCTGTHIRLLCGKKVELTINTLNMKIHLIFIFLLILGLSSCNNKKYNEKILGTWEFSIFIDSDKAKTMFEGDDTDGLELEATFSGTENYLRGGRYNTEGEVTFRVSANGQEIPLKLSVRESGSWEFHDNYLITIADDSKVSTLDETTRNVINNAPEFAAMIEPVKGESSSTEIINISETSMQVKTEDLPGLLITYQKK